MKPLLTLVAILVLAGAALGDPPAALRVGDPAPDFVLPYATRDSVAADSLRLSALVGRKIVLAFYPADWSGGCTREVCALRDNFTALSALDAEIVGISGDYVFSHHEWAKHHQLPFRLASDHRHEVAKRYDSYNDEYGFNRRTVYVVGRDGRLAYIDPRYSVRDTVSYAKLREALARLK